MVSEVPQVIKELVDNFERNKHYYTSSNYVEENAKTQLISPFFKALGWDVDNESNTSQMYVDVLFEESIECGGKILSPDYTFRYGIDKVFFVEAKKPYINLKTNKDAAFQIRRYGYYAGLSLCILTNFKEFAIYETTDKPIKNQSADVNRIGYYEYTDYIDKWDEIAKIFSRDSIRTGEFHNYVTGRTGFKKGTSKLDEKFSEDMDNWRVLLAKNITLRNKDLFINEQLSESDLSYVVQLIIDRIIFLRILEDRQIENTNQLKDLLKLSNKDKDSFPVYEGFIKLCKKAGKIYNNELFYFTQHNDRDYVDTITPILKIDDKIFVEIFKNLYYPYSYYNFNDISAEILGSIYERFLRKRIKLTSSYNAKIEKKPESKSKEGIFPTPPTIAKHIVKITLDKALKGKTPNQVAKMKFVDPACGSGTFLLELFQYLIDWHIDYYSNMELCPKDKIYKSFNGYKLTLNEKKKIVLNNIYGVDIDEHAIEVSKLGLLLKILEDSNKDEIEKYQLTFQESPLPYLGNNICFGNSLIDEDIFNKSYLSLIELKKMNPFNWKNTFSEIFKNGGFDVVIGHPPLILHENISESNKKYLNEHYSIYQGNAALYIYFFEKGLNILKKNGYLSFISYNKYIRADYGISLRKLLLNYSIENYKDYSRSNLFELSSDPSLIIVKKCYNSNNTIKLGDEFTMPQSNLTVENWVLEPPEILKIHNKILSKGKKIIDLPGIEYKYGAKTGFNKAFIINEELKNKLINKDINNKNIIKPVLRTYGGNDVQKWRMDYKNEYIIFARRGIDINKYPIIKEYLSQYKQKLTPKNKGQKVGRKPGPYKWYELQDTLRYYENFEKPKVIHPDFGKNLVAIFDDKGYYMNDRYFMITSNYNDIKFLKSLACLLSSNLLNFMFRISGAFWGPVMKLGKNHVGKLVICNLTNEDKDDLSKLYDEISKLSNNLNHSYNPKDKSLLKKQINIMDNKINRLVYTLYNLTDEEIKIIEKRLNS